MGLAVNLSPTETTLGREQGNTVVLNSTSVSRRHARIVPQGGGFAIEDLGSANGIRVNGMPVTGMTPLKNGDQIDLGEIGLLFETPQPVPANPLMPNMPPPGKKQEIGSAERATQASQFAPPSRMGSDAPGCDPFGNILNDLSGCLPALMKLIVPLLIALAVAICLGGLLMFGIGSFARNIAQGASTGGQLPPASGSTPPAGQTPPPAAQDQAQSDQSQTVKITILSTKVIRIVGADQRKTPTLLVKWRNDSDQAIQELDGTVTIHLPDGHTDVYPKMKIYVGNPVQPGQTHEDTGNNDGVIVATDADPQPQVTPTEVK